MTKHFYISDEVMTSSCKCLLSKFMIDNKSLTTYLGVYHLFSKQVT